MDASLDDIRVVKERVEDDLLALPNVVAVGIGRKVTCGEKSERLALRVYVTDKVDVSDESAVPAEIDGVPTDVVEVGAGGFSLHQGTDTD